MGQAYGIQRGRTRNILNAQKKHDDLMAQDGCERGEEGPRCTPARCKSCCKSFTAFLFSTVGLVIMVAAYSVAGGFLFQMIEEKAEQDSIEVGREVVHNITKDSIEKLWDVTFKLNILYRENWTAEAHKVFATYQKDLYIATVEHPWDGEVMGTDVVTSWHFSNALLYAVTAITTIGYGHVTPKTKWGMGCTIIYCLIGLPLTLMCIANLGKFFARVFRILYHTCCCGICCICCLSYRKRKVAKKLNRDSSTYNGGTADLEALGNGQTLVITNDPNVKDEKSKSKPSNSLSKAQVWMLNVKKKFNHSLRDDVTVPVYLCLVVMAAYIMGGALLFSLWDDWGYLVGAYFCFVTLTTIGFGDYVPGVVGGSRGKEGTERLVLCSLYVFFGLALVGMCIDLMQADVLQKLRWIAQKIGIMSDDNRKIHFKTGTEVPTVRNKEVNYEIDPCSSGDDMEMLDEDSGKCFEKLPLEKDSGDLELKPYETFFEVEIPSKKSKKKSRKAEKGKPKQSKNEEKLMPDIPDSPTLNNPLLGAEITTHRESNGATGYKFSQPPNSNYNIREEETSELNREGRPHSPEKEQTTAVLDNKRVIATIDSDTSAESDHLCLPPPGYSETCKNGEKSDPTTPASYYDDLPTHISNLTPEHQRLREVSTPSIHKGSDNGGRGDATCSTGESALGDGEPGLSDGEPALSDGEMNEKQLSDSTQPLLERDESAEKGLSMEMKEGEDGELTLTVSRSSDQ